MIVHLVDGTYKRFRHVYGLRRAGGAKGSRFGAVAGVLNTVLQMTSEGATHLGVATDRVIESFRNERGADTRREKASTLRSSRNSDRSRLRCVRWLATLRTDAKLYGSVDEVEWHGPTAAFASVCERLGISEVSSRTAKTWMSRPTRPDVLRPHDADKRCGLSSGRTAKVQRQLGHRAEF